MRFTRARRVASICTDENVPLFFQCDYSLRGAIAQPVSVTVFSQKNISAGGNGRLESFMSTSFQPAEWDYAFFRQRPGAVVPLWKLAPRRLRIQPVSQGVPQKAPDQWDFRQLDAVLIPVLGVANHSPELQLATAPSFMNDAQGHLMRAHFRDFANYCANVVRITTRVASMRPANIISLPARIT